MANTSKGTGLKINPVTITHTINMAGFNLTAGMLMDVKKVYFRNGETQLKGFVDGRKEVEEVPSVWTNAEYI